MPVDAEVRGQLARRFEVLLPHLNERQQRLALATEARLLGHGGVRAVAEASGVSATTVRRGVVELESGEDSLPVGRARRAGGGRRRADDAGPGAGALPCSGWWSRTSAGDPMSPLRWTTKSLRHLAEELARQGHPVSAPTVGRLLRDNGFSLQGTAKTLEGAQHPDRDAQFRYINEQVKAHQAAGEPVISVDAKKKEQLGQLPAAGREWRPKGDPVQVEDHSFFTAGPDVPAGRPVRRLRPHRRRRLGERRGRSRHLRVRRGLDPALVAGPRRSRLPRRAPVADHRGRGRLQQLPLPALEGRAGGVRRRDRPGRSPSAISRPAPASGTRSSTGCSPRSP